MPAKQIYSVVNKIAQNISWSGNQVIDVSSFVAFTQDTLSDPMLKESVYDEMFDILNKTIFAVDVAKESDNRGIIVDQFTYGSILRKISFLNQSAETASEWDIEHPENPYTLQRKEGIIVKYFENYIPAFCYKDVVYETQLEEAFASPESLAGFVSGLYQRMYNAYSVAKQGLSDAAIGALVAKVYEDATAATPSANASRQVRHLLTEYNTAFGTSLTDTTSRMNSNYLEFVRKAMLIDKENLDEFTASYNDGTVERRTSDADYKLDISVAFATAYDKFWGDTYHEGYVQLPKFTKVRNWGMQAYPETIKVSLDGETTTTVAKIIGVAYDKDAVIATLERERFVALPDTWNMRRNIKLEAERRYCADISENVIIYLND